MVDIIGNRGPRYPQHPPQLLEPCCTVIVRRRADAGRVFLLLQELLVLRHRSRQDGRWQSRRAHQKTVHPGGGGAALGDGPDDE